MGHLQDVHNKPRSARITVVDRGALHVRVRYAKSNSLNEHFLEMSPVRRKMISGFKCQTRSASENCSY
jgi:hypothetical protein